MQAHDSNRECSEASALDGRRDDAGSAVPPAGRVVFQQATDAADRALRVTHCNGVELAQPIKVAILSANLSGKGGLAAQ